MQREPEKTVGNYNELRSVNSPIPRQPGVIELQSDELNYEGWQDIIIPGLELVRNKISQILGSGNKLDTARLVFPTINIVQTGPEYPNWAGYFSSTENKITLVADKIAANEHSRTKVLVHELIHFLSHNARDDSEGIDDKSAIAQNNNVGFRRDFGLDIREGSEGEVTRDYFLSFNEAVTEQLTIDIFPGAYEAYHDYRGLLNKVIDDAVVQKLGSESEDGTFVSWSRDQVKNYIYMCFFRGDLTGLTNLLKNTYIEYDISEQQFGLMTHKDDLPSIIKKKLLDDNPGGPPPAPCQVAVAVQRRLDNKTDKDYATDIIDPKSGDGDSKSIYGTEYDTFVETNGITPHDPSPI
jgi:hypothetical protein